MHSSLPILLFVILFNLTLTKTLQQAPQFEYHWKDFTGKIPSDALPLSPPEDSTTTHQVSHIGQAYIHGYGLFVVQIPPGLKTVGDVDVAAYGPKKASNNNNIVKILCTDKPAGHFSWFNTTSKSYQVDMVEKLPVIGGYDHTDNAKGVLHIGRAVHNGVLRVGSIAAYAVENSQMAFIDEKVREVKKDGFEVLLVHPEEQQREEL